MNPDRFKLNEILRYFLSGSILIASLIYSRGDTSDILIEVHSTSGVALLSLLSFTAGAILYSVHRSIIYWALGRFNLWLAKIIFSKFSNNGYPAWSPVTVTEDEYKCDRWRWKERYGKQANKPRLDEWASQIHFLYTTTLAIWIGSLIGAYCFPLSDSAVVVFNPFLFCSGLGTLFFGCISDLRRRHVEIRLMRDT